LNEAFDQYGRLTQLIGNLAEVGGEFGSHYADEHGEDVTYGTIQVWNVYNLSADTHPMHFHLFNVMVMRRQSVKLNREGMPVLFGRGRGPEPNETGWKETVRMNPGECTTVAVLVEIRLTCSNSPRERKEIPRRRTFSWRRSDGSIVNSNPVPSSPRLSSRFGITAGEYVWHCHILEHEEHDMMHSLSAAE
jgi:spore coat protein A